MSASGGSGNQRTLTGTRWYVGTGVVMGRFKSTAARSHVSQEIPQPEVKPTFQYMQPRLVRRARVSVLLSGALVASVALLAGLPSAAAAGVRAVPPAPVSHLTATATSSAVTLKW